ncbi:MAG TPA: ATP-binding protein [Planosporangium sp.]|nr:ATP-binding protein [Planosporangium sp.]
MADETRPAERPPALLSELFDHQLITAVRHAVARLAARSGLTGPRLDDFVLAVNEMMTNAVRHAGGSGVLTLWCQDEKLQCEVVDKGPGIPAEHLDAHPLPSPFAVSGRGLWLAHRLCDNVTIRTGRRGTTVHLIITLPR